MNKYKQNGENQSYNRQLIRNTKNIDNFFPAEVVAGGLIVKRSKPIKHYPPGCSYEGEWMFLHTWEGQGRYVFPHGVTYEGDFEDSQFHGKGILRYPMGQTLKSEWSHGKMTKWSYVFKDGLEYHDPWEYCLFPKRAYISTVRAGVFKPPGQERVTNKMPPRPIPPGCFDVGEGFYKPKLSGIVSANETNQIKRIPTEVEADWIKKHCRNAEEGPVGYRPDLYEYWCTGTAESVAAILKQIKAEKWREVRGEHKE